ncbi:hypothetical protein PHLGIDRAFT_32096 [Phlebiopsis gigantea 11061_1 CR5-6]|uniref:Carboxylesterase type B domain-containing protein n=1 Tax=Phlebiopsis gigantea (strain 11061_1 CR5-6) TaxID=745531 RepID=A0A0C3NDS0_PHLG1|nr:hypothetical protein PHLGIDRAFT_32096 [Phlebiopsis gigantea 11061_1 CR5-6]
MLFLASAPAHAMPGLPTVTLDQGTFTGVADGLANKFLGIPFAQPPTGDLRFRLPAANEPYRGNHDATAFGLSCPQQDTPLPPIPPSILPNLTGILFNGTGTSEPSGEDCLTLNVWTPAGVTEGTKLPVVAWIYGGGFETGSTSTYDGGVIVGLSVELDQPVVYVSMNYRLSALGFLASQEVKDAGVGNLGLQDQRQAFRWIQKYISAFNGDPSRVTIWGESAGAISVAMQMITNRGNPEGLFHAAFMESGSPIPVGDITHGQKDYDALVQETGCSGSSNTLECLRRVPFKTLMNAINESPNIFSAQSLDLAWTPRADGTFLADDPQVLVQEGSVANIPFVTGDCDDEGTLFSLSLLNISTEAELRSYLTEFYLPNATAAELDQVLALYPQDPTQGSPFDTGLLNVLSPQFKRLAALQGDLVFQAPRRFFLSHRSGKQNTWSFLNKRLKSTPGVGSAHGTDLLNVYAGGDMAVYLINFVNNLDPNASGLLGWPKYTASSVQLLTFLDGSIPLEITQDTYRQGGMNLLTQLSLAAPL